MTHQRILLYLIVVIICQAELWRTLGGDASRSNGRCVYVTLMCRVVEGHLQVTDVYEFTLVCNGNRTKQYVSYLSIYRLEGSLMAALYDIVSVYVCYIHETTQLK